ncbi:t-SNARE [Phlyctochytrium arcticum]|nr:t-SNARE [Phlyctochytrium arcticum]
MRDRMADLKEPAKKPKEDKKDKKKGDALHTGGEAVEEGGESPAMKIFFDELSTIKDNIAAIRRNVDSIESLHQKALNMVSEDETKQNAKELDRVMDKTNKLSGEVRQKLKAMDVENKTMAKKAGQESDARIRASQHGAITKKFLDVMNDYKSIQQKYQEKYKQRLQRQFLIVKPQATADEVEKMMDGQQGPVFAQQIMQSGQRGEAKRALQDIQDRHQDIMRIEQSIIELQQLFMDMAVLVQAQGEMLNQIEIHVSNAAEHTDQGVQQLGKAIKLQKKARKKMCIIICCLLLLMVAIALAVYFGTKK